MTDINYVYKYKKIAVVLWFVVAFLFFILSFIVCLEGDLLSRMLGIFSFAVGLFWLVMGIHALRNVTLATTEDEILFSEWPFAAPLRIPTEDIVKVKIQMDKKIWPGVLLWFDYKDGIRKVRIITKSLRQEDQKELRSYLEDLIEAHHL